MTNMENFSPKVPDIAAALEHSVLKPSCDARDIRAGCRVALRHGVCALVVPPFWLGLAVSELAGSGVKAVSVLAFPHGNALSEAKAFEAERLAALGAVELDMVMNVGALKSGETDLMEADVRAVVSAVAGAASVKVILETCLLTDEEIVVACRACERAGAAFVKTSTGFGAAGATREAVSLMRRSVGESVGVKASGGIRTLADVMDMMASGAGRIGTSSTEDILEEWARMCALRDA